MSYYGYSKFTNNRVNVLEGTASDLDNRVTTLRTEVDDHETRVQNVETWIDANTDEISKEVDKAINDRVTQTAYDATVAQLQNTDSSLNQAISQAVIDRQNVLESVATTIDNNNDKIKEALLAIMSYVEALDEAMEVYDPSGNRVFHNDKTSVVNSIISTLSVAQGQEPAKL